MTLCQRTMPDPVSIVLIGPDEADRRSISAWAVDRAWRVACAASLAAATSLLRDTSADAVFLGRALDRRSKLAALDFLRANYPTVAVLANLPSVEDVSPLEVLRRGAFDALCDPYPSDVLLEKLHRAAAHARMKRELSALRLDVAMTGALDSIIGDSPAIGKLRDTVGRIAATDIPIVITGPPGSGKTLAARVIHYHSHRRFGPLVSVDCAAYDEKTLHTVLFGSPVAEGRGTPPVERAPVLAEVNGGTLYLRTIDHMPASVQTRLLEFLQDFQVSRGRPEESRRIDVRTIAATSLSTEALAGHVRFEERLLARLNVVTVQVPGLAERRDDIALLSDHLLRRLTAETDRKRPYLSESALCKLTSYEWPGNVRELRNTLRRSVILCSGDHLRAQDIHVGGLGGGLQPYAPSAENAVSQEGHRILESSQRAVIRQALADNNWNFTQTARALGIGRTTLWRKVKKFRLKREPESLAERAPKQAGAGGES